MAVITETAQALGTCLAPASLLVVPKLALIKPVGRWRWRHAYLHIYQSKCPFHSALRPVSRYFRLPTAALDPPLWTPNLALVGVVDPLVEVVILYGAAAPGEDVWHGGKLGVFFFRLRKVVTFGTEGNWEIVTSGIEGSREVVWH